MHYIRHMWNTTIELNNDDIQCPVLLKIPVDIRYDTYQIFYIPVNFFLNLPHYVTSYMHHTGKKESKKEILKKEKK